MPRSEHVEAPDSWAGLATPPSGHPPSGPACDVWNREIAVCGATNGSAPGERKDPATDRGDRQGHAWRQGRRTSSATPSGPCNAEQIIQSQGPPTPRGPGGGDEHRRRETCWRRRAAPWPAAALRTRRWRRWPDGRGQRGCSSGQGGAAVLPGRHRVRPERWPRSRTGWGRSLVEAEYGGHRGGVLPSPRG